MAEEPAWAGHISESLINRMLLSVGFVSPGLSFEVYFLKNSGSELQCLLLTAVEKSPNQYYRILQSSSGQHLTSFQHQITLTLPTPM